MAEKQNAINQVSADYEKAKSEQRIKAETVTRELQKIIDRPVYKQFCFDPRQYRGQQIPLNS